LLSYKAAKYIYIPREYGGTQLCHIGGQNWMKPASSRGGIRSVYWDGDLGEVTFEIVLFYMGNNILV